MIAGKVQELPEGVTMAAEAIDTGKARDVVTGLKRITNGQAAPAIRG